MNFRLAPLSVALTLLIACGGADQKNGELKPVAAPTPAATSSVEAPRKSFRFTDVSAELGVDVAHFLGIGGQYYMPEIASGGGALFDYDGDGALDIYLVNSAPHHGASPGADPPTNRLLRQGEDGRFTDVTGASGLGDERYGLGVAVGDVDNDGDLDLLVTNDGPDALFRNDGKGHFADVTETAGIAGDRWSTSAAFFDYDADGWLDLYVASYVDADLTACIGEKGEQVYCGPAAFEALADRLYHNNGDGTFTDVSQASEIFRRRRKGLGVVCLDLNGDGRLDIYVANDRQPNLAWINQGDGTFVDEALVRGLAVNEYGLTEASMGIAVGDIDGDADIDLLLTHLKEETNTLYVNDGERGFRDTTAGSGLGVSSLHSTGFGAAFLDADLDGDLDLAIANGAVRRNAGVDPAAGLRDFSLGYGQPNQFYENLADGRFTLANDRAGDFSVESHASRGMAVGDIDGDGDLDVLVVSANAPVRLFRNDLPDQGNRLTVGALDRSLNRHAIGARVTAVVDGRHLTRRVRRAHSYLASSDPRLFFGLGTASRVDSIEIAWPDGSKQSFGPVEAGQEIRLWRGEDEIETVRRYDAPSVAGVADPHGAEAKATASSSGLDVMADGQRLDAEAIPSAQIPGAEPPVLEVLTKARAVVVSSPKDANAWGQLGRMFHAHRAHPEAVHCYSRALVLDPDDHRWPYLRALILLPSDPAATIRDLDVVLRLRPGMTAARVRRGDAERAVGRMNEAREAYRHALASDERCVAAHLGLAQLLADVEPKLALEHLRHANALAPGARQIRLELARQLHRLGRTKEAQRESRRAEQLPQITDLVSDDLLTAIKNANVSSEGALHRAARYQASGDLKHALVEFDTSIRLRPGNAPVYNNRGLVREKLGDIDGAFEDMEEAIRVRPTYVPAYINRAGLRMSRGDRDGALADLDHAIELDPEAASSWVTRAHTYYGIGEFDAALRDISEALRLNPRDYESYRARSILRRELGDLEGSAADAAIAQRGLAQRAGAGTTNNRR